MLTLTHITGFAAGTAAPDITAPTITSSNTASVQEDATLAHALTANESVTWSIIGGADQARLEISGSTLRWASNGTKDFEAPDDADTNNTYVVDVRATDGALNTADQTITVTVTDVGDALLDGLTTTGAWSMSRALYSDYTDDLYEDVSGAVATLYDQSGNARDLTEATNRPAAATAGPNSRVSASFDGTNDKLVGAAISNFIANSAGYIVMSGVVDAIGTNGASVFSNDAMWTTSSGFLGIHLKSAGTVHAYNWDGNADSTSDAISTGDAVVVEWRHDGGNIMGRINKGTWQSAASGNTTTITGLFTIGAHTGGGFFTDMHFVEGFACSTVPDEATRDTLVDDMMDHIGAV